MNQGADSWKDWLKRLVSPGGVPPGEGGGPKPDQGGRMRTLLILILLGAGLLLLVNPGGPGREAAVDSRAQPANGAAAPVQTSYDDFVDDLERQVALAVTQIAGVGNAVVLIVPKTSEARVLAEEVSERESRPAGAEGSEGGGVYERSVTRRPITVTGEDGRRQEPVVLYTEKPEISGALIVADGARDPRIQRLIVRAVSTALGIPPHRVEVVPKKP